MNKNTICLISLVSSLSLFATAATTTSNVNSTNRKNSNGTSKSSIQNSRLSNSRSLTNNTPNSVKPISKASTSSIAAGSTSAANAHTNNNGLQTAASAADSARTTNMGSGLATNSNPTAPTQTQNLKIPAVPNAPAKADAWKFSGIFDITREAQLKNQEDGTRAESFGFDLLPKISYGKYSATLWLNYSKDLKDPEGSDWGDPVILLGRAPWDMGKYFKFGLSFIGMVPYSKASTEIKQYKGSLGVINNFILNSEALGVKNLSTNLSFGFNGNYYDSTTDIKGEPLNQYSVNQKFNIGYSIGDFSISAFFWHFSRFSYENVVRESFNHGQGLGYNFNSHFNIAIGAYNEAPMYKGPSYDFNLRAVDDTSTKIYAKTEFVW